jgi:hypothetical protein
MSSRAGATGLAVSRCGARALAAVAGSILLGTAPVKAAPPAASDPGPTPAELTGFTCTPTYEETCAYLRAVAAACRYVHVAACGYTTEGRPIPVAFVWESNGPGGGWEDGESKPVVLITAGIHSGEICGSDALLLLLRDIARGLEPDLTAHLRLILVPIFNVDGHVRRSPYNRFTQVGPECGFGRRRNALNLDLNRDFAKLETPECQALVRLASQFRPHIYMDLHTDDGIGHQYDILYDAGVNPTFPEGRAELIKGRLLPSVEAAMARAGFRCRPIGQPRDRADLSRGFLDLSIRTRYSTGYSETRQTISILSEAYPYTTYERRVRATGAFVRATLAFAVTNRIEIRDVVDRARAEAERWALEPGQHPIGLGCAADTTTFVTGEWLGKKSVMRESPITGARYAWYGDEDSTYTVPYYDRLVPQVTAPMPRGYLLGPEWGHVASRLKDHCIAVYQILEPFETDVEVFRIHAATFEEEPCQGHHPIEKLDGGWACERRVLPPGSFWVPLDQPGGLTAMQLLEPESPDALLVWNFFDTIFENGMVLESWALEEKLGDMLTEPEFRARYEAALADSSLPADPEQRLRQMLQWTPYAQEQYKLYPAFRSSRVPPAQRGL